MSCSISSHFVILCFEQLRTISAQVDDRLNVFDSDSDSEDEDALKKAAEELKVSDRLNDRLNDQRLNGQ